jgi:hypothetical protein
LFLHSLCSESAPGSYTLWSKLRRPKRCECKPTFQSSADRLRRRLTSNVRAPSRMKFCLRLLASLALAFALIGNVFACSCITRITTAEHYAAAKHIFIGRVISLHEIKSRPSMPGWGGVRVGVQMEKMLKGIRPFSLALSTGHGAGDCGVPMFVGSSYIFFVDANRISRDMRLVRSTYVRSKHMANLKKHPNTSVKRGLPSASAYLKR